jgi:hypothetical protein
VHYKYKFTIMVEIFFNITFYYSLLFEIYVNLKTNNYYTPAEFSGNIRLAASLQHKQDTAISLKISLSSERKFSVDGADSCLYTQELHIRSANRENRVITWPWLTDRRVLVECKRIYFRTAFAA